jgi:ribosomal protein L40E
MSDLYRVLLLFLAVAAVIVPLFVGRKLDRRRIHEHVEANGGKVIDVARRWFGGRGGGRYMNAYDVTYKSRDGKRVTATCITSMTRGVYWISDRPPDGMETSEEAEAADPTDCLQCGAKIPPGKTRCPRCGWSYAQPSGQE